LSPTKHPIRCHQNPVLRKKRGDGAGIVLFECLLQLQTNRTEIVNCLGNSEQITLLDYYFESAVFCVKAGNAKQITDPAKASSEAVFIVSYGGQDCLLP
jgi:hypothetical protein